MKLPSFYPILDTASLSKRGCEDWVTVAGAILDGGAQILQIRHKADWTRSAFDQARVIAEECSYRSVTLIINDRADIAALVSAGVHVGQDDLAPDDCRKVVGREGFIGLSTHTAAQLAAGGAEEVDYLAFGPVFPTTSKLNPDAVVALEGLSNARKSTRKPLVAIGGITRENAVAALAAGADSVAVLGDLLPETITKSSVQERVEEWRRLIPR